MWGIDGAVNWLALIGLLAIGCGLGYVIKQMPEWIVAYCTARDARRRTQHRCPGCARKLGECLQLPCEHRVEMRELKRRLQLLNDEYAARDTHDYERGGEVR